MNGANASQCAVPLQASRDAWNSTLATTGLATALFLLASMAAAPLDTRDVALLLPLSAIAAWSIGASALIRRYWATIVPTHTDENDNATLLSRATQYAAALQSKISEAEWWQGQLEMYAANLTQTQKKLHQVNSALEEEHMATLETLASTVDARDPVTYGHCRRVAELAFQLAGEMGLTEDDRLTLERAALLHDIGKLGVPDSTLQKTTPLTPEDSITIRHHPELGYRMLSSLRFLGDGLSAIRYHHERIDGSGYPYGLVENQIPIMARVLAVADAYDAITSDRPYRPGRSQAQGMAEIVRCSGTHFDPDVVDALLRVLGRSATPLYMVLGDSPTRKAPPVDPTTEDEPSTSARRPFLALVDSRR